MGVQELSTIRKSFVCNPCLSVSVLSISFCDSMSFTVCSASVMLYNICVMFRVPPSCTARPDTSLSLSVASLTTRCPDSVTGSTIDSVTEATTLEVSEIIVERVSPTETAGLVLPLARRYSSAIPTSSIDGSAVITGATGCF